MSQTSNTAIAVIGIDIGKNSFHVVGHDARGAIVLRQKWSRGQVEARLANVPPCLIGRPTRSTYRNGPVNESGTAMPSALAALRLMVSSTLVDC